MKTALALIQTFARLKGLAVPASVVGSTDAGVLQLMEVYNSVGKNIGQRRLWSILKRSVTFTSLGVEDQGLWSTILGEDPAYVVPETAWNNTLRQPIFGPLTDEEYRAYKATVPTGPLQSYYVMKDHLYILGTVTAGNTLAFTFKSKNWLQTTASSGTFIYDMAADTNVPVWDDNVMMLGLEAFWRRAKDLPFTTQMADFEMAIVGMVDNIPAVIKLHGMGQVVPKPGIIVPLGNWNVS